MSFIRNISLLLQEKIKQHLFMKKIFFVIVAVMMTTVGALAQIPSNVQEVMDKCNAKMSSYNSGAGFVLDGTLKMKVSVLTLNGTIKMYFKDDKSFNIITLAAMGEDVLKTEMGFDGQQEWVYTTTFDDKKDSLVITKTTSSKNEFGMKSDYDKDYKKAKMKEVGRYYEITFTEPRKKDLPKKSKIKVDKESYLMREYSVEQKMGMFTGTMTVTVTKITKGCNDKWVKLDMNRYKNAVVVRK